MQRRRYTKAQLKQLFSDLQKKRISDGMMHALVDETYNEPVTLRTSGFYVPGGNDAQMSWNNSSRTLTLTPVVPDTPDPVYDANGNLYVPHFRFYTWDRGPVLQRHYAYDAESELPNPDELQLPNEEGLFAVYYALNADRRRYELTCTKNPTLEETAELYISGVIVAWIYWDATAGEALYFGDSRHGSEWNPQMHWMLHQTINSQRQEGISITDATYDGDGTLESDYLLGITSGKVWHDDILKNVGAVSTSQALPVWYIAAGGHPTYNTSIHKKFITTGTGRVAYNPPTGGIAEAVNNHFVVYHLFATNCLLFPHISAMGQASHESLGAAVGSIEAEVSTLRQELPHANLMHIGSFVLQTSDGYTNSGKAIIVYTSATEDVFVSDTDFDTETGILTLFRSANRPPLKQPLDISTIIHNTIINEGDTIINIINEAAQQIVMSGIGCCKESFIIEHTTDDSTTQLSSWFVLAYNQLVGEFKATVMVRDKDDDTVHTVESILSFDYTDPSAEVSIQNDIITEAITTLVLGIDANHQLYATVTTSGETASDGKRIHFCFERCVLSVRHKLMEASGTFELEADAELTKYIDLVLAEPITFELDTAGVLQGDGNLSTNISFTLNAEAALDETGIMMATVTMSLNVTASLTAFVPEPEFGLLYNFAVIENTSQIAPTGYRAANTQDVINLINYLGGETAAGGPLKSLAEWTTPNTGATNASGFSGLPAGYRDELGAFLSKLIKARVWIDNR